jgi:putative transposase
VKKKSTESVAASGPTWETLEAFARQGMQRLLQRVLEEEVDELLGRGRYARRVAVDAPGGYRNGFGKPRRLSLSNGTIREEGRHLISFTHFLTRNNV